jgi:hypothetical protein
MVITDGSGGKGYIPLRNTVITNCVEDMPYFKTAKGRLFY